MSLHPYPELRQLFGAYLNADFVDAYGSVAGALRAYADETSPAHREALRNELARLRAHAGDAGLRQALHELGCEVAFADAAGARRFADALEALA